MRKKEELRAYQRAAVKFVRNKKRCGLFVDPGLGKTAICLTAFTELIDELACGRVLVVAPPRVAKKTWPDEFAEWAHTQGYSYTHIVGTPEKRRRLLKRPTAFHIISSDLLPWLLKECGGHAPDRRRIKQLLSAPASDGLESDIELFNARVQQLIDLGVKEEKLFGKSAEEVEVAAAREAKVENKWRPPIKVPYSCVILDESTKAKSHDSNRFRSLRLLSPRVEYFLILTGTPAANGMQDLWAQIYLLDQGKRLGQNITAFRERWCKENYNGHGYFVQDFAQKVIEERIYDIVFTLREEDYADLPPRMYNTIKLEFEDATRKKYKEFERSYVLKLSEEKNLLVNNGAAITTKLLQLANGVVYDDKKEEHFFHDLKLDALQDLVNELNGEPVLVAYEFKSDVKRILARFKGAEVLTEGGIDRWNKREIPMLLVHRKSAAHGLNLQFGGNTIVWYTITWSLEDYIQLNKRLHRSGQKKPVMIHHLIVEGTMDEDAMEALLAKNDMQESLLNALKKRIRLYK